MPRLAAVIAALLLLAGCSESPVVVDPVAQVTVYGQVSRPAGGPAPGVSVVVEARERSCANHERTVAADSAVSGASGEYRVVLWNFGTAITICVNARVVPPPGTGSAVDSAQRAPVQMRSKDPDSLRVDIVLRPTP
jgi:hypothetical protein